MGSASLRAGAYPPAEPLGVPEAALPAAAPSPAAKPLRLRHVDSLRAVAAGLVVWTHVSEDLLPFAHHRPAWLLGLYRLLSALAPGRLGVDVFFAISGFVIPRSFGVPPEGASRRFLIRRFCRLYPVFWVSVAAAVCLAWLDGRLPPLATIAANVTMIPYAFGRPAAIGLYWTLNIEWIFYGLCLVLYRLGWLDHRGVQVACTLGFAAVRRTSHLASKLTGWEVGTSEEAGVWLISLALMFWGTLFRSVYEETGGFRQAPWRHRGTWLLLLVTLLVLDVHEPQLKTMLLRQSVEQWGERMVTLNAMVLFALWVALLRLETRFLTFVGVVSYSLYLFHPLVSELMARGLRRLDADLPLVALLMVGAACSVALAAVLYRWVEAPAIDFGKRWAVRGGAPSGPAKSAGKCPAPCSVRVS